jgi:branched-chain amino acid transport system permease protein
VAYAGVVEPATRSEAPLGQRLGSYAAGLALLVALPWVVPDLQLNVLSRVVVFAIFALSINVLVGYTGQVSLGHNAFIGMGAFGSAYTISELGAPWSASLVVAATTGAIAALVLGGISLRIRGLFLALVTLAYGVFAQEVVFNIRGFTGGGAGLLVERPAWFTGDRAYAYVCIGFLVAAFALDARLTSTRTGRAILAIRDDERVAASWGVNVTAYKLLAFVISGLVAGVAGALFASIEGLAHREDYDVVNLALVVLLMAVIGGVGSRIGVIQGAVLVALLPDILDWGSENLAFPVDGTFAPFFTALLVVVVLVVRPGGMVELERRLGARFLSHVGVRNESSGAQNAHARD